MRPQPIGIDENGLIGATDNRKKFSSPHLVILITSVLCWVNNLIDGWSVDNECMHCLCLVCCINMGFGLTMQRQKVVPC